ncbi:MULTISPECIES: hypothetical protein [unclassified Streptomyces]|uniref:hypothetical protein n=1 Tax=unclassified Streptomyces TaxID=2593676 RepID=UPI003244DBE5
MQPCDGSRVTRLRVHSRQGRLSRWRTAQPLPYEVGDGLPDSGGRRGGCAPGKLCYYSHGL